MLFSHPQIAEYINARFEPVWVAVREVPIVRIDFGNGRVLTRTLHGNIATYVCTSSGQVLDVLPGIYAPLAYVMQLEQFAKLHGWFLREPSTAADRLAEHHRKQAQALAAGQPPVALPDPVDRTKTVRIEGPLVRLLLAASLKKTLGKDAKASHENDPFYPKDPKLRGLWDSLATDTEVNETQRRQQIHSYLADGGLRRPEQMTRWLYREVLHADLDDPYLGLSETLFASYPFDDAE